MKIYKSLIRGAAILCCLVMVISMFSFSANAAGTVETLAAQLLEAVEQGQRTVMLTVQSRDLDSVLRKVFDQYPALFVYYNGYSSRIYTSHTDVTFTLQNHDVAWDSIYVARSLEDVRSMVAYNLGQLEPGFRFVMAQGPLVTSDHISDFAHDMMQEHYFAYMGYNGNQLSYQTNDRYSVVSYEVNFHYWEGVSLNTLAAWRHASEQKALELASTLFAQDMPDYRKELLIHDWLVNNNRYNTQDTSAPESHMAYSALVSGNPVCQGYAEAALVLLRAAGVPAVYVDGEGTNSAGITESHAWNCVQIQGQWYNLDVTWDDPTSQNGTDTLRYTYFNITDSQLAQDHRWDRSLAPQCNATAMDYNRVRSLVEGDSGYYSDYSTRNLNTRDMTVSHYGSQLQLCPRPDGRTPSVSVPQATTPAYTSPGYSQPSYTQPVYTTPWDTPSQPQPTEDPGYSVPPGYTNPWETPGYTQPGYTQPGYTQPEEDDNAGAILGGLAGLAGIGAAIFGAAKKRRKKDEDDTDQPMVFDPNNWHP